MKRLNKGLLPAAIAAVLSASVFTQAVFANPELVADFTPGTSSSYFKNVEEVGNRLDVSLSQGLFNFLVDEQGNIEFSVGDAKEFSHAVEINGELYIIHENKLQRFSSNGNYETLYQPPEAYYDIGYGGDVSYYIKELFVDESQLHAVISEKFDDRYGGWEKLSTWVIDTNTGNAGQTDKSRYTYPLGYSAAGPTITWQVGNKPVFLRNTVETGEEFWAEVDGGSRAVMPLMEMRAGPGSNFVQHVATFKEELYFVAVGENGRELYKINKKIELEQVADINSNGGSFKYEEETFYEFNGALYFSANDGVNGYELWKTDGTSAGTFMIKDSVPGADGLAENGKFHVIGETEQGFYFGAQAENVSYSTIWYTDGTTAGTFEAISDPEGISSTSSSFGATLHNTGGSWLISTRSPISNEYSLWLPSSDSTSEAIRIFDDNFLAVIGSLTDKLHLFSAKDDANGAELWVSDGTLTGTRLLKDIYPGSEGAYPSALGKVGSQYLFKADDGVHGRELWVTDGTEVGTKLLIDLIDGSEWHNYLNPIGKLANGNDSTVNDRVIFEGYDTVHGRELWVSDGTVAGTKLLKDIREGKNPYDIESGYQSAIKIDDHIYFMANSGREGVELWVTDGSEENTKIIGPIHPTKWDEYGYPSEYPTPLNVDNIVTFKGSIYFQQYSTDYGTELWKYTPESTTTPPPVSGTGSLGDFVWIDTNANGIQDASELGLEGVSVELQSCSGEFVSSTTTDSMGAFRFENVAEDHFQMQFMLPSGYEFSPEKSTPEFKLDSNANVSTGTTPCYDMTQGYQRLAVDAGMVPVTAPSGDGVLGDYVWQDSNGDGVQDANEPGLANVTVNLQSCSGAAVSSTTTDSNGNFLFENIGTGDYRLEFELLNSHSFSPEKSTDLYQQDSNANTATGLTGCYDMSNGWKRRVVDAGMVPDTTGSADNLTVVKAIYFSADNKLWVRAESDASPQGSAYITASVEANGTTTDLGTVGWKADKGFYQTNFRDLSQTPSTITLMSDLGGEVTADIEVR